MSKFRRVSKEEFNQFVEDYPNKLDWDVCGISEPPTGSHNDFTGGKIWPESVVTRVKLYDGSNYYGGRNSEYFVKEI